MTANTRLEIKYENLSGKFMLKAFDYEKQFSHLYSYRLAEMTALIKERIKDHWGDKYTIRKLCDCREDQTDICIIIGTIYKHQAHKPSILREISEENQLAPQPQRQHYSDPEDKLILEDELQRVRLEGKVNVNLFATGVVCAALGCIEEGGRFIVEEMLFHESGPQRPIPVLGSKGSIVLISGLDQVQSHNFIDALNMFQHWLSGNMGTRREPHLVRLIIAGNSVRSTAEQRLASLQMGKAEPSGTVEAMHVLDTLFATWSNALPIDVMPGAYDPANFMLPQQPFHSCMFPLAAGNKSFQSVPNPYACTLDDSLIIGTSGQNVSDLLGSTELEEALIALRSTLVWGHLAPTAPDTLACYPYVNNDPFILRECPHIYFAGNCEKFATELYESATSTDHQKKVTRLVCVPSFARTQSVAVVDLETLECRQVSFNVQCD